MGCMQNARSVGRCVAIGKNSGRFMRGSAGVTLAGHCAGGQLISGTDSVAVGSYSCYHFFFFDDDGDGDGEEGRQAGCEGLPPPRLLPGRPGGAQPLLQPPGRHLPARGPLFFSTWVRKASTRASASCWVG